MNFIDHIKELAQQQPEAPAILRCDMDGTVLETISRSELLQKLERTAYDFKMRGLVKGDRVALATGSTVETLIFSWAAWSSGIVTVPLDTKRDTEELRAYKLQLSHAKTTLDGSDTHTVEGPVEWAPDSSHEALILFTSGTTAKPKGVRLTLENLIVNADAIAQWLHITKEDCFLVQLPLHHINSTTLCLSALLRGATIAVVPQYSNSRFWEQVANSGATITSIVPSIVFDQLNRVAEYEKVKPRLRLNRIQLGSAPVVAAAAVQFVERFGIPLYQGYGQTETALRVAGVPTDLPPALYARLLEENSIGVPLSWATVEIMDASGAILAQGEEGELVVKGAAVMQGYLAGEAAFRDGWFPTGDIGYWQIIDGRRFFFLKGRKKEIIIKGGVNISPVAVENSLQRISADIEQAYVVGVGSVRYGEEVGALVVWKEGVDPVAAMRRLKIRLLCGTTELNTYETPQFLCAIDAAQLPMTSTGKVQRTVLKEVAASSLRPIQELFVTDEYQFVVIDPHSPLYASSRELYNHCWQPLTLTEREYERYLTEYLTLGALDTHGTLQGQISFSYSAGKITCVSLCSKNFKPKAVPQVDRTPTQEEVHDYLLAGHDPVMNFHQRLGATLVEVIPQGRPADHSALGYTMLLSYPPALDISFVHGTPVSRQLVEAARILGADLETEVYALSRPGGLAAYIAHPPV